MTFKVIRIEGAALTYIEDEGEPIELDQLSSRVTGGGKAVAAKFVCEVGRGREIYACVTEKETRIRLNELGLFNEVLNSRKRVVITDKGVLQQLKIVRVLNGGGIRIREMCLDPIFDTTDEDMEFGFPDGIPVSVEIRGTT